MSGDEVAGRRGSYKFYCHRLVGGDFDACWDDVRGKFNAYAACNDQSARIDSKLGSVGMTGAGQLEQ